MRPDSLGRAVVLGAALGGCDDGPEKTPCEASTDCPGVACGPGVEVRFCKENYCETDPEVVCEEASTVGTGSGGGST